MAYRVYTIERLHSLYVKTRKLFDHLGYHNIVTRYSDGTTGWTEIASVAADQTSYQDSGLTCDTAYSYRMRAYRSGDDRYSDYSNIASASTAACPGLVLFQEHGRPQ